MSYDLSAMKKKLPEASEWLKRELGLLRTGRASPALLDNVFVDYYGAKQPLKHVGAISTDDARTLRIRPWDTSLISQIDQAVRAAGMGLQAIAEKDSLRIIFPELTEERRKSLLKVVSEKLEEARISIRKIRDEYWKDIQEKQREGKISEDEKFRLKEELEKLVSGIQKKMEEIVKAKEKEIEGKIVI